MTNNNINNEQREEIIIQNNNKNKKTKKKKMIKIIILILIILVVLASIITFFNIKKAKSNNLLYENYNIITVQASKDLGSLNLTGVVTSDNPIGVFVDKQLKVKEVFVKDGDVVKKGDLLMEFDDEDSNRLNRNLQKESINNAKLQRDLKVAKELYTLGGSSKENINSLLDAIQVSNLTIAELKEEINKTAKEIRSPYSGVIGNLKAQKNYLVDTRSPLLDIIDLDHLKVTVEVPEHNSAKVKVGQKAIIRPEVFEGKKEFKGNVIKISKLSTISQKNNVNVLNTDIALEDKIEELVPGFIVDVEILFTEDEEKIMIPNIAIREESKAKYFVYVVDDKNTVHKRNIEIDGQVVDNTLIKSGLNKGDKLIVNPDERIKDKVVLKQNNKK